MSPPASSLRSERPRSALSCLSGAGEDRNRATPSTTAGGESEARRRFVRTGLGTCTYVCSGMLRRCRSTGSRTPPVSTPASLRECLRSRSRTFSCECFAKSFVRRSAERFLCEPFWSFRLERFAYFFDRTVGEPFLATFLRMFCGTFCYRLRNSLGKRSRKRFANVFLDLWRAFRQCAMCYGFRPYRHERDFHGKSAVSLPRSRVKAYSGFRYGWMLASGGAGVYVLE